MTTIGCPLTVGSITPKDTDTSTTSPWSLCAHTTTILYFTYSRRSVLVFHILHLQHLQSYRYFKYSSASTLPTLPIPTTKQKNAFGNAKILCLSQFQRQVLCVRGAIVASSETVADARGRVLIPELVRRTLHLITLTAADNVHHWIHVWKERSLVGCSTRIVCCAVVT